MRSGGAGQSSLDRLRATREAMCHRWMRYWSIIPIKTYLGAQVPEFMCGRGSQQTMERLLNRSIRRTVVHLEED